jgi:hypothetical protein
MEDTRACVIPWVFVHPDGRRIKDFRGASAKACRMLVFQDGSYMTSAGRRFAIWSGQGCLAAPQ